MQSPSDTPAAAWPGAASARSKVTAVPSSMARRVAHSPGFSTSTPTKAWWVAGATASGTIAGRAAPKRGSISSSKELHCRNTPPVSRGSVKHISGSGLGRDPHVMTLEKGDGGVEVRDLHGDGVHPAAEAGDELGGSPLRRSAGRSRSRCPRPRPSRLAGRCPARPTRRTRAPGAR